VDLRIELDFHLGLSEGWSGGGGSSSVCLVLFLALDWLGWF